MTQIKKPPNNTLFGSYNVPIDVWNPWVTSNEVIMRIKNSVQAGEYKDALLYFEEAQRELSLEELNAVKSACAEEIFTARKYVL